MNLWMVPLASLLSLALMLTYAKLAGYRQISQLSYYDYINTLTLGNLAAQMATSVDDNFPSALIAMVLYAAFALGCSHFARKSRSFRGFIAGQPIVLMHGGKIYRDSFTRARINLDDFEAALRAQGYFDVNQVGCVIMEHSGQISVLPKSANRPLTPGDLSVPVEKEALLADVIMDGKIMTTNLRLTGHSEEYLKSRMRAACISLEDVFLATMDQNGAISFYRREAAPQHNVL